MFAIAGDMDSSKGLVSTVCMLESGTGDCYNVSVVAVVPSHARSIDLKYKEIETCIECSAANLAQVYEVFYCAQKAVLHPIAPLFDQESQRLSRQYIRAMERIFILYDHDMDGALNDRELNEFQVKCFSRPLQSSEIVGFKIIVWERVLEGVNEYGITLV
ncbi:mitochondrial Rho GTPase 1 [Tanacetum coccineum]